MPATASTADIHQALFKFVTDGLFPESESVTAAEYPVETLPAGLDQLSLARKEVEKEIVFLSKDTASDVDDWISQAKQLHEEIESSKLAARDIVTKYEKAQALQRNLEEAAANVRRLNDEIGFTGSLHEALIKARSVDETVSNGRDAIDQGNLDSAIQCLEDAGTALERIPLPQDTSIIHTLTIRVHDLRYLLSAKLEKDWNDMVYIDRSNGRLKIQPDDIERHATYLANLQILANIVDCTRKSLLKHILYPVLSPKNRTKYGKLELEGDCIQLQYQTTKPTVSDVMTSIASVFSYLKTRLPDQILSTMAPSLAEDLIPLLISEWLSPAIPVTLQDMNDFQSIIDNIDRFSSMLTNFGLEEPAPLATWRSQLPRLWLSRRRSHALDQVRFAIFRDAGAYKTVERTEKQQVAESDELFQAENGNNEWDADWGNEEEEEEKAKNDAPVEAEKDTGDEDMSAWGLDDDDTHEETRDDDIPEEDVNDAWGWGDDENDNPDDASSPEGKNPSHKHQNLTTPGNGHPLSTVQKEIVLTETYSVTGVPDAIIEIITTQISDAENLQLPVHAGSRFALSGTALLGIPTLVVAMFKATAPMLYSQKSSSSQMYLYNDSVYLAERLQSLAQERDFDRLNADIDSIIKFGRISYGREMHTQRTILADILDGCQGFASCNTQPYLKECENAISTAVQRVIAVRAEWEGILSRSALLQSIGSLISTGINKMIIDIEDLSDISEPESQRLADFCSRVSKLEEYFLPDVDENANNPANEQISTIAVYVPNWLKFQYLMNILESSLADIKYLWSEGELKLEFSSGELIDLIKALFADSDHRKKAISEIRSSA
ncbi:hypothetical protein FQN57_000960 [Myotisia sp. PD_48]|nr:hypothetical protein FQN57_000960 [Myotisia sp. PD_48]